MLNKVKMCPGSLAENKKRLLKDLFPDVFVESKNGDSTHEFVDFEKLKCILGDLSLDGGKERYQLTWPGKRECIRLVNSPSALALRPLKEKSANFSKTKNVYIEGDNLEVLKALRETYLHRIKMIYIDPPYNTGNDFVYKDDFRSSKDDYREKTSDLDDSGNRLVKNPESNGRFHSDWLDMMYPRLLLARDFLQQDGVIFISIDDNEVHNLREIGDEIFGNSNFIAQFPWRKRTAKSDVPFGVSQDYEWILAYAKSDAFKASVEGKERKYFETPDFPGRLWRIHDLSTQRSASERPNSFFDIEDPKTGKIYKCNPNSVWRVTKDSIKGFIKESRIVFPGDYSFLKISNPVLRYWKEDDMKKAGEDFGRVSVSTKLPEGIGLSQDGTKEIQDLFGAKVFPFPKPVELIKFLIRISTGDNDVVMDFFSGSGTTAQSVFSLNQEEESNRSFILVQLPEKIESNTEAGKLGYKNICDLAEERIRLSGKKYVSDNDSSDFGFRVFKVDSSNMVDCYYSPKETTKSMLSGLIDEIKPDRTDLDLLFQMMVDHFGLPLSSKIEEKKVGGGVQNMLYGQWKQPCCLL